MEGLPDNLRSALAAAEIGLSPIPCHPLSKVPTVKWKEWQGKLPPRELIEKWFADTRRNIAIVTSGMVVFDCDDPEKEQLVLAECGDTPHRLLSPRGGRHLGFRKRKGSSVMNQVKIKGLPIDIRTDGGLEMIPPSETEFGRYEWLGPGLRRIAELPVARIGWTRERKKLRRAVEDVIVTDRPLLTHRARSYLGKIPGAVSGQQGHNATFRVCCLLVQKFGLSEAEAWPLLLEWNQTCQPPWSERELAHKLSDALKTRQ